MSEAKALGNITVTLLAVFVSAAIGLSVFLFGLDLWVAIQFGILLIAGILKMKNVAVGLIMGILGLGFDFSYYLYGFFLWPSVLLGILGIIIIATHFLSNSGTEANNGDQNPIIYIAMIVSIRAFIATVYSTESPITDTSPSFLSWITIFVLGIIPGFPVLANLLLFIVLNGTLITYLILLGKRIANPLAN